MQNIYNLHTKPKFKIGFVNIYFTPDGTPGGATRIIKDNIDYIYNHNVIFKQVFFVCLVDKVHGLIYKNILVKIIMQMFTDI